MLSHTCNPIHNGMIASLAVVAALGCGGDGPWEATATTGDCGDGSCLSTTLRIPMGDLAVELVEVAAGLGAPVQATHAGDGSGRLFIVDQAGLVQIIDADGNLLPTPFIDVSDRIVNLSTGFDERGLLGLAFHPEYSSNGRFFMRCSASRPGDPSEPCFGTRRGCHSELLVEYKVSDSDPNRAVAPEEFERILLRAEQPEFNHNGGHIAFGPDGFLYMTLGDGGGSHDGLADMPPVHGPMGNGQNLETWLGALLRIDVDRGRRYAIPEDNPFVDGPGLDEIYAYGFRNPYRFSFDGATEELILADVGQSLFEEINTIEPGGNYGWAIREGRHCFDPLNPSSPPEDCQTEGLIDPFAEYDHEDGQAIIGGHVYRGSNFPELVGKYVFADFSKTRGQPDGGLFWLDVDGDRTQIFSFQLGEQNDPLGAYIKGMGEDEAGEIYVLTSEVVPHTGDTGKVWRIQSVQPTGHILADIPACEPVDLESTLALACASGDNEIPINPSTLRDSAPPHIDVGKTYGVRLQNVDDKNEGTIAFVAPRTDRYLVYLGTPNVPFHNDKEAPTCSRYLSETRVERMTGGTCEKFRGVYALPLTQAGTEVRVSLGPISPQRWVRFLVLPGNLAVE